MTGPGVIRHIWITVADRTDGGPFVLRDLVLRAFWDGADTPAVGVPLGDFFCNGFATRALVNSIPIVVAPTGGMNSYFPMPFRTGARLTLGADHVILDGVAGRGSYVGTYVALTSLHRYWWGEGEVKFSSTTTPTIPLSAAPGWKITRVGPGLPGRTAHRPRARDPYVQCPLLRLPVPLGTRQHEGLALLHRDVADARAVPLAPARPDLLR
jgi:Protein of unknown function (DUF2961)